MDISVRLLDCVHGVPAAGVEIRLDRLIDNAWQLGATAETDDAGRVAALPLRPSGSKCVDRFRCTIGIGRYFAQVGVVSRHPEIAVLFLPPESGRDWLLEVTASTYGWTVLWVSE